MKNTIILLLACLILIPFNSMSQHRTTHPDIPKRFKVGDMYYPSTVRGVRHMMHDIKMEEPEIYNLMLPDYENLLRKRNATLGVLGGAGLVGTTLFVGSLTFWQVKDDFLKPDSPLYDPNAKKANLPVMLSGIGVITVGGLISLFIAPTESDVYNFVNTYNRNNPNRKMDWQIGFNLLYDNTPGLKLTLKI